MKVLNLDALSKSTRSLTLGGVTYEVKEMTVENFIETTKQADALENKKDVTFADQIETTIAMIQRQVPGIPPQALRELTIEQLVTISKFLRGELDNEVAEVVEEDGEKK